MTSAELTKAVLPIAYLPTALIVAGRWKELVDLERHGFPPESRSAVNLALAAAMLASDTATQRPTDGETDLAGSGIAAARPGPHRWAVLSALARMTADRREQFWARTPPADAAELRRALHIATLPITAEAFDALLAADTPATLDRDAATVLLTRALHTPPPRHHRPDPALVDRICALAAAAERVGDVVELLDRAAGGRWADWRTAEHAGRQWPAGHRGTGLGGKR